MPVERIFLVRCGEHTSVPGEILDSHTSATGLPRDPDLSEFGLRQARDVAARFAATPRGRLIIYSSPTYRCLRTAQPVAELLGVDVVAEAGLGSWYIEPRSEGNEHPSQAAAGHLPRLFPKCNIDVRHRRSPSDAHLSVSQVHRPPIVHPPRNGESVNALHRRAEAVLKRLVPRVERQSGAARVDLLIVTHAPTAIALSRMLSRAYRLLSCAAALSITQMTTPCTSTSASAVSSASSAKASPWIRRGRWSAGSSLPRATYRT